MRISSFQIENYKSFRVSGEVQLAAGFNVIVGQNNVGKTALVEALSLSFGQQPHRSLKTVPVRNMPVPTNSTVTAHLELSRDELLQSLARLGNFWVPIPDGGGRSPREVAQALGAGIRDTHTLTTVWSGGALQGARFVGFPSGPNPSASVLLRVTPAGTVESVQDGQSSVNENQRFEWQVAELMKKERVYAFDAERLHIGISPAGPTTLLRPDATNLPEVLQNLQGRNQNRFLRLTAQVRSIFSVVRSIGVTPREGNQAEILIWTIDPATEREDLAVRLEESGTGIAQVLALLYVVLTADFPQVILMDEPQSFLHPGAVRKLIEILKQHPQHQFIITTHSPTALTAADPDLLLRLHLQEAETIIQRLDVTEARDLRLVLADVGARLSDVFGADSILWVEGRTEELCFPRILTKGGRPLLGTAVMGVMQTGDFEGRRSKTTVEIYERLSSGRGLLPPAIAFIFDREGRTAAEQEGLRRRGKVLFLPRRMYENYLLHPQAIAGVASSIVGFRDQPLTADDVQGWINQNKWNPQYFDPLPADRTNDVWVREVNAARLLGDLFSQLSGQRVAYDKIAYGVALTDWLLSQAPMELAEVGALLDTALNRAP